MKAGNRQCGRTKDRDDADAYFSCVPVHLLLSSMSNEEKTTQYDFKARLMLPMSVIKYN